ncbi:cytochrome P450 [Streptomyces spectabilis]|uniref:Pentalenene oxygenase n=2 Tax=Streptomyces spectabilis TaxID=68270 RepID=A0A7W8F0Q5_STRST|nr:cytochrome P450 [Streptomyces spectabilis]MBB5110005.1 pentalenene oxygenase [Streptomyces spectabilis]
MATTLARASAPGALPFLGHSLRLAKKPLEFLRSLPAYGDLVEIRLGPRTAYIPCTPELTHQVLIDNDTFDKVGPGMGKVYGALGREGVGTCPYRAHRRQRGLLQPAFNRTHLAHYSKAMTSEIAGAMESWRDGQVIDVPGQMHALTTRVTARALFASSAKASDAAELQGLVEVLLLGMVQRLVLPLPFLDKIPTPANRRFVRAQRRLREITSQSLADYRDAGIRDGDLLSVLFTARDSDGQPLSGTEVHDNVVTFLLAGTETAATALSWAWHLLGEHPAVRDELHAEVDSVLAGRPARYEDLPQLKVVSRIITESLRIRPPAWLLSRMTTAEIELAGRRIPAGSPILCSVYLMHHLPDVFQDPDRFDPDRWLDHGAASLPRGAHTPFGVGTRKCIGDMFAMNETVMALASVATRWQLDPVPGVTVRPIPRFVLAPHPLPMRLQQRRP